MPIDRNKFIRYQVYDRCFANFKVKYSRSALLSECNRALRQASLPEVSQSTVNHDISENGNFVTDLCPEVEVKAYKDIFVGNDKKEATYYRYAKEGFSIWRIDLDETQLLQLQNALLMLRRFRGLPKMEWVEDLLEGLSKQYRLNLPDTDAVVEMEHNMYLTGMDEYFEPLLIAILQQQVLHITYNAAYRNTVEDFIHPYYLKEFNCRWFVMAWSEKDQRINNMAIDRIEKLEVVGKTYRPNVDIDFQTYFDDVVGVTVLPNTEPELIRLRFTPHRYNFVRTNILHPSQHNYDDACEITISVCPNKELTGKLLYFGKDVTIVEASETFREEMRNIVAEMYKNYGCVQEGCTNNP